MSNLISSSSIIIGDFNTPLAVLDRSSRKKLSKEILDLNLTIQYLDLADIYRTFHPNKTEYTYFSSAHGTYSKIDHILGHNSNLSKFKGIEIIPCIFSDHHEIKVELSNNRNLHTHTKTWKLNNWMIAGSEMRLRRKLTNFLEQTTMKTRIIRTSGTPQRQF